MIKLGFGRTGWGGDGSTQLDEIKRWGLASYEDFGLGDYGVPAPAGGGWNNTHTQLTFDFDDVFRIPENWGGFVGTSDLTGNWDFSWGEFEADALVDDSLVDQVLGLELVDPSSPPFGLAKTGVNGGTLDKPGQ